MSCAALENLLAADDEGFDLDQDLLTRADLDEDFLADVLDLDPSEHLASCFTSRC